MHTQLLKIDNLADRQKAEQILLAGGRVAIPTETVYGLGAVATNEEAVRQVFAAKGRPLDHPLIVHVGNLQQLDYWVAEISETAKRIMEACWPGPLTLIFKKHAHVSSLITAGLDTIAIRMPALEATRDLIASLPHGLVAPSANPHKQLSPTSAEHVLKGLGGKIEAVLDAGPCDVGLESTILDVSGPELKILRAGPFDQGRLSVIAKVPVAMPAEHKVKVAGNMKAHYQPVKPLSLIKSQALMAYLKANNNTRIALLHIGDVLERECLMCFKMDANRSSYAKALYATLHAADKTDAQQILVEVTDKMQTWPEIMNRLERAAHS